VLSGGTVDVFVPLADWMRPTESSVVDIKNPSECSSDEDCGDGEECNVTPEKVECDSLFSFLLALVFVMLLDVELVVLN